MATLQEQLARHEWDPDIGAELIGSIVEIGEGSFQRNDGSTYWYPVVVVRDGDGTEHEVRCSRGGLFNPIVARQPDIGARIGIRYDGTVPTGRGQDAHRYRVAFDDDDKPKQVDWSKMTGQTRDTADVPSTDAWPKAPEPTADEIPY